MEVYRGRRPIALIGSFGGFGSLDSIGSFSGLSSLGGVGSPGGMQGYCDGDFTGGSKRKVLGRWSFGSRVLCRSLAEGSAAGDPWQEVLVWTVLGRRSFTGGPQQGVGRLLLLRFNCWLWGSRFLLAVGLQAEGCVGSIRGFKGTFQLLLRSFRMLLNARCGFFDLLHRGGVLGCRVLWCRLWVLCLHFLSVSRMDDGFGAVVGDSASFWKFRADHVVGGAN